MSNTNKNEAMIEVLLERMEKHRLPRLIDIKEKLDQGKKLDNYDLEFLEQVISDARDNEHYLEGADEKLKNVFMRIISLYKDITDKALENEKKS